jgi:hypothetical protein
MSRDKRISESLINETFIYCADRVVLWNDSEDAALRPLLSPSPQRREKIRTHRRKQ